MTSSEYSTAEVRKVKRVQFGILAPNEIRAMSVCEVSSLLIMENGLPKELGIMDPRLGTVDRNYRCKTCSGTRDTCPGHFGHIELARPCYHVGYLSVCLRVLRCVCYYCSQLLCDKQTKEFADAVELLPRNRLNAIRNLCDKQRFCGSGHDEEEDENGVVDDANEVPISTGCGREQPKYRKGTGVRILVEFAEGKDHDGEDKKQKLTAQRCYEIFSRISEVDAKILGFDGRFSKPEWCLIRVLPVSPPAVRPFVLMDGMRPSQDDLTHKLYDIVKTNNALKRQEARGVPEHVLEELVELLQFHVTTMIDNEVSGQPQAKQKSGKPIKSLRERLVGKAGRVRGNLMGKRCDFSARTVIGGDSNLSIDEVGVPRSIAMNLTYPERVTKYNLHKMKQMVENGPNVHPGAKTIIRSDGKQIDLRYVGRTADMNLEPGYIVERHIQNGDIVLFNRQPSLHKMSMMAHHVRILPWSTFRINLSVTSPYNADFDGDEMNLHVPQSENGRAELIQLCKVPTQIVSPQSNRPVMGIVQDTLLGVMKFTKRDSFFRRFELFNLLMMLDDSWDGKIPIPAILKPEPLWTGKQILSLIIPKVNVRRIANGHPDNLKNEHMSYTDTIVRIEQGELMSGIVDKRTVGTSAGSLIHVIFNEKGPIPTMHFINECNRLIAAFLLIYSSSIGVGDTIANDATLKTIEHEIETAKQEVARSINKARNGNLKRRPGSTLKETFEAEVNGLLNRAMNQAGKSVKASLHKLNNIKQMVDAGSKGNAINISQIIACVGQQNVMGKRIPYGFSNRTLPHFNKGDLGPESRGFVSNSYLQGLTPQETYFHAMGGREGLVDTAVKTASTGYIQRRLIKAMEDVMVCYDRTVRNSLGHIIQFLYGEDGLDATAIEKQRMPHILLSNAQFKKTYEFEILNGRANGDTFLDPLIREQIRNSHSAQITLREEIQQLRLDREFFTEHVFSVLDSDVSLYLPVNIKRLLINAQKEFGIDTHNQHSEINPVDVVNAVQELCAEIIILPRVDTDTASDELRSEADQNATMLFKMLIRALLASKRVCNEYHLTRPAFNYVIGEIKSRFDSAIVCPGEVVGTIAAQSIGEPATQMTLNTFHFAGVSAKNVTLGVPRLAELINVAQNIKTPSLTIHLKEDWAMDQYATKEVLNKLEYCKLRDVVAKTQIYYDPDPKESVVENDREFLEYFFDFPDADMIKYLSRASPWMLRLVLDRNKKEDKSIKNSQVADKINSMWNGEVKCLFSNDNAEELVLQIRMMDESFEDDDAKIDEFDDDTEAQDTFLRQLEEKLLDEVELRGIPGIEKVFMRQENRGFWDDNHHWDKQKQKEWVLDTEGSALLDVMAVEEVDDTRTYSNHIVHIFTILGIEASRQALLNEVRTVISFDGSYVNYRHLAILVDSMTYQGHLMSITRHGINRRETGPIMRSSFEETVEILLEASHFAMADDLLGVSENILLGQLVPIGTGAFDLLLDDVMLEKYAEEENENECNAYGADDGFTMLDEDQGMLSPSLVSPIYNKSGTMSSPLQMNAYSPGMGTPAFSPETGSGSSPLSVGSPSIDDFANMSASPDYNDLTSATPAYGSTTVLSPNYSPRSPGYSPTSPTYSPTSPTYSPTSPTYSPTSPTYSPTSPTYSPTSPTYSPTSPTYSPTSPTYSPTSPTYSPTSPTYSPTSPTYSPTSPTYSPTSPTYSPTSPTYSPTSPTYSPTSPTYSPTSPTYSPTSPTYSPTSPTYSPTSPSYSPTSPTYSPTSPTYSPSSPSSPAYSPNHGSPLSPTSPSSPHSPTSPHSPHSPASPISPTSPTSPSSPTSPMSSPQMSPQTSPFTPSSPGSPQQIEVQYTPTWMASQIGDSASSGPDYSSSGTSTTDHNASVMEMMVEYAHTPSSSDISSSTDSGDDSSGSGHDSFSPVSGMGHSSGNYSPSGMGL